VIDLYFWPTPNGYKITILLEELGWRYNIRPIHIGKGEQFAPAFAAISPNNKIPALIDHDGPDGDPIALFESGAIMLYLAEKAMWRFLPAAPRQRSATVQWLMFQMAHVGPMLGQAHHFRRYAPEPIPYAIDRYTREARRIYDILNRRLEAGPWLAGEYSLADMAVFPWIRPHNWQGQDLDEFPGLRRWYDTVAARPAVQRGLAVLRDRLERNRANPAGRAWEILFANQPAAKP
jgi:GST-like protein